VVKDIATYLAFYDAEICLMDINEYRLSIVTKCVHRIVSEIHRWFYNVFPWELGYHMKKVNLARLEQLAEFNGVKIVKE